MTLGAACARHRAAAALCLAVAGCGGSTSEQPPRGAPTVPPLARRSRSAWRRRATRSAWRHAGTSCGCGRRRRPAPSCARCTPRSTRSSVAAGQLCLADLADRGQLLFEHEYNFADGLGGGAAAKAPAGPFRRVHGGVFGGPETISCPSCHWVGGPNGAGAETDDAFLEGDGERTASGDARNPPALVGLGVVQALAREMSRDLQRQRDDLVREAARAGAAREVRLDRQRRRLRRPARHAEGRGRRVGHPAASTPTWS